MPRAALYAIIAACFISLVATGYRSAMGLFVLPISHEMGWSVGVASFFVALHALVWGIFQPIAGVLADRYGSARIVAVGAFAFLAGLAVMAEATSPLTLYIGGGLLFGIGLACVSFGLLAQAIGALVPPARRSAIFGIVAASGAIGQTVLSPWAEPLIREFGWSVAAWTFAIGSLLILPLCLALRARPDGPGEEAIPIATALAEARRHPGYLMLVAGFFVCGFQLIFMIAHLPAYIAACGLTPDVSAAAIALIGLFNAIGCWAFGWAGGRWSKKYLLAGLYLVRTIAITLFVVLPPSPMATYIFAAVAGLVWLGTAPLTTGLVVHMFGLRAMGALYGLVFLSHQIGSFSGAALGGVIYDVTGGYESMWMIVIALGLFAAVVHASLPDRPSPRMAAAAGV